MSVWIIMLYLIYCKFISCVCNCIVLMLLISQEEVRNVNVD